MITPQEKVDAARPRTALSTWARRHRRPLGLAGAAAAVCMTGLWLVVVPEKAGATVEVQQLAIRWGHPVCWAFLAVLGILVAADAPKRVRDAVGIAAALCYAAFIAGMVL